MGKPFFLIRSGSSEGKDLASPFSTSFPLQDSAQIYHSFVLTSRSPLGDTPTVPFRADPQIQFGSDPALEILICSRLRGSTSGLQAELDPNFANNPLPHSCLTRDYWLNTIGEMLHYKFVLQLFAGEGGGVCLSHHLRLLAVSIWDDN